MCGIIALVGGRPDEGSVERALDVLARRGPDGRGIYVSPDRRAVLGHTRLAIVDVEGGVQPLASEDGRNVLVFNGEIYGHADLRAELERKGHRFKSRCDAEIALHLYEELGPAMLHRLRGEYAFAIWDDRERRLFAARDRFGVKPLVYAVHDGVLHVASQAKALFASGIPSRWDHESFFQAASLQYTLPDATLFEGIRVLPPGHFLLWNDGARSEGARGSVRLERYWDLDYPTEAATNGMLDMRSAATTLRDRLAEAVRVRLVADVPVAFQLSGGIDSSAVLALASTELGRPADAFTVAFDDVRYDERSIAEEMAARVGARLHVVSATAGDLLHELPGAVVDGEGLAVNAHIAAKRMLARAIHEAGYKVVLTGEGADEILAGYAHLRCDLAAPDEQLTRREPTASEVRVTKDNGVSAGLMLPHGEALDTTAALQRLGFVPTWLRAKASLGLRIHGLLRDDWLASIGPRDPVATLLDRVDGTQLQGRGRVEQALYLWSKLALEGYILRTLGDGMEMAFSIEGRLPFLDHHVFELVRTFPTSLKIRDGVEKSVLRAAIGSLLTERLRTRQKHPFLAPPLLASTADAQGAVPALTGDLLGSRQLAPFFDPAKVSRWLDRLPSMTLEERTAAEPALMIVLSATLLHTHYRL